MLTLTENSSIAGAKKWVHGELEGNYKYVAYYFANSDGQPISNHIAETSGNNPYVLHRVCFSGLVGSTGYLACPELLKMKCKPEYVVYIPKFRFIKKEVALTFLREVVGKFHWFKDVIVDFDPERIWKSQLVAIPFNTSRIRVLTSFNMVRYLDEFPAIVQNWYDQVIKGDKPNTWAQFRACHLLDGEDDPYCNNAIWDHALFKPHMPGVTLKTPKEEMFDRHGSVKKVFVGEE